MTLDMRTFWNRRASEDAFYFVDNRLQYRRPDHDQFWAEGAVDLRTLLEAVGATLRPTDRVLDIGCGVGRLTRALSGQVSSVCAIDVSERMLEMAQRHNRALHNVEWVLGDGATLAPVPSASVDACVSHVVFQHIPDPEITLGYIREIGRVLKHGGWAAFQVSNDARIHASGSRLRQAWRSALAVAGRRPRGQNDPRWRGSMVEVPPLREAARDGGMVVERLTGEGTQWCCVLTRRQ